MIVVRWAFQRNSWQNYKFIATDEYGITQSSVSTINIFMKPYIDELLTDIIFARKLYGSKAFKIDKLSKDDQMDLLLVCLLKLEDDSKNDGAT